MNNTTGNGRMDNNNTASNNDTWRIKKMRDEVSLTHRGSRCGYWEYGSYSGSWDLLGSWESRSIRIELSWDQEIPDNYEDIEELIETKIYESYD